MAIDLNEENADLIARRFRALSDPTRLRVLNHLRTHDGASVGEIAEAIGSSQQNVSKHLATLHEEAFVSRRRDGTSMRFAIADPTVMEICERVCAGLENRLEELHTALAAGRRS
jgi:ArsR family transcriptional regulator